MRTLVWFRQDLRLADNPALAWAAARGDVVPVYVLDDHTPGHWRTGAAARWWLHHSLAALAADLGGLVLRQGMAADVIPALAREANADAVAWNRCYEPFATSRDASLKASLRAQGLTVESFKAGVLFEPWEVQNGSGADFKVFTPFWKACLTQSGRIGTPLPVPQNLRLAPLPAGEALAALELCPTAPDWAADWPELWQPGEAAAMAQLEDFLAHGLAGYSGGRDFPAQAHVSRLSPALHWGNIGPRQLWAVTQQAAAAKPGLRADADKFLSELGWREFAHHLLYHAPTLPEAPWRPAFAAYPWREAPDDLRRWQRGQTGYPLVDAGMRALWHTGWLHNRVRMVVASFLIKHLRIDWRAGQDWFWDTLLDADLANNAASWQWVAGSGADAAPYFRIFNPFGQGERFDPAGDYVRRWVPELAALPAAYLHAPWLAPAAVLAAAGVRLGETYPAPMVDHEAARAAALAGYEAVKAASAAG